MVLHTCPWVEVLVNVDAVVVVVRKVCVVEVVVSLVKVGVIVCVCEAVMVNSLT